MTWFHRWQTRLGWKLMTSYVIVIVVGMVTLALVVESVIPTAFNRHMLGMQRLIQQTGTPAIMPEMQADLFTNFRAAVTEALLVSTGAALVTAIIVSFFVSRRVITPIRQMMQASRHIAAGHYRERVEVISEDELGQLAHSFNQMAATLEHTETLRRDLIANVAHELRTPLTSIKGYMEGLMDGVLTADPDTYQQICREADRLRRLVDDLQELSRVEAGAFTLNRHPLNVAPLIRQMASRLLPQFEEKGVALKLDISATLSAVLADEDRLNQALLNLIGNALQYTPAGGTVTITARLDAKPELIICVSDTGIGIPAEHLPHLFTRFYRIDKSRSRVGGGSGIGLTIAKHLVEAHGGHIWATSVGEGRGSIFGFSLPLVL